MVRFGILGAGNIAHRFAGSLAHVKGTRLVAVSRRSEATAREFLGEVPCAPGARAYGNHNELLADPEVDALYLALPHQLHRTWAIHALRAGKAVLCEKPACISEEEVREVADASRETKTLFMEAQKARFQPVYQQVIDALPEIGQLRHVEATLCNNMLAQVEAAGTYHMTPGPGSGVLLDCGTYCASWIDALLPRGLQVTSSEVVEKNGIDVYARACLEAGGMSAVLECAFDRAKPRTCTIVGERGQIVVDELHRPQRAVLQGEDAERVLEAPYEVDDFYGEIVHFVGLVEAGVAESPVMPLASSLRCAAILDDVRE